MHSDVSDNPNFQALGNHKLHAFVDEYNYLTATWNQDTKVWDLTGSKMVDENTAASLDGTQAELNQVVPFFKWTTGPETYKVNVGHNHRHEDWFPDDQGNGWRDHFGHVCTSVGAVYDEEHEGKTSLGLMSVVEET